MDAQYTIEYNIGHDRLQLEVDRWVKNVTNCYDDIDDWNHQKYDGYQRPENTVRNVSPPRWSLFPMYED